MRILRILLFTYCVSAQASPFQWVRIAEFSNVVAEIDESNIVRNGELTEATFRFSYSSPQKSQSSGGLYRSAEVKALFKCVAQTFVPFERREFKEQQSKGGLVGTATLPASELKLAPVIAGSMNEAMYERACTNTKK